MIYVAQSPEILPARRNDLIVRPFDGEGRHVIKDPRSGQFFSLGPVEHFLLTQLDGQRTAEDVATAYLHQFGEPLGEADLQEFLELAQANGFLQSAECEALSVERANESSSAPPNS